jgi:SOS-response transcriptional repressor LexA
MDAPMSQAPEEQGQRLKQAREKRGFDDMRAACDYFGWNYNSYVQHERGERGLVRAAAQYAAAYKVSAGWLLTGDGETAAAPAMVPLVSWVSAGALEQPGFAVDMQEARIINAGELPGRGHWIALEVQGDSMDRISPPGSIIIVDKADKELVPNACYVIREDDGAATYKRYKSHPDRFEPASSNPAHEPIFPTQPITIIGRVRKTILAM